MLFYNTFNAFDFRQSLSLIVLKRLLHNFCFTTCKQIRLSLLGGLLCSSLEYLCHSGWGFFARKKTSILARMRSQVLGAHTFSVTEFTDALNSSATLTRRQSQTKWELKSAKMYRIKLPWPVSWAEIESENRCLKISPNDIALWTQLISSAGKVHLRHSHVAAAAAAIQFQTHLSNAEKEA